MIGRELGGYRIIEQIGIGGMATVYKAYDPKTERNVAIKILPQQYSLDPTFKTHFDQEARAIANLEHIHILPVFAYGEEDGISYMVMRPLNGGSLSDRICQGALELRAADGRPLAYNDDAPDDWTRSQLREIILPADGEYTLVIASYGGSSTGRFAVQIVRS